MLPNHKHPIPQREQLLRIIRNRRIHRSERQRAPTPGVERRAGAKVSSLAVLALEFDRQPSNVI